MLVAYGVIGLIAVDVEVVSDDWRTPSINSLENGPYFLVNPSIVLVENKILPYNHFFVINLLE